VARTVRTAMLAPERTAVGWQAHVHRRKLLARSAALRCLFSKDISRGIYACRVLTMAGAMTVAECAAPARCATLCTPSCSRPVQGAMSAGHEPWARKVLRWRKTALAPPPGRGRQARHGALANAEQQSGPALPCLLHRWPSVCAAPKRPAGRAGGLSGAGRPGAGQDPAARLGGRRRALWRRRCAQRPSWHLCAAACARC